jgi:SAM-dependent methyltransferase
VYAGIALELAARPLTTTWDIPAGSGDRWPEDYERGRPGWPLDAVRVAGLQSTASVLDLGAGTGKLTRLLVSEFDRVMAVEPAEEMRRLLVVHCPDAVVLSGAAQELPVVSASVDAVYAAQAFHWFDEERAVAEIARVLRPGGSLILMWNRPGGPWEPSTNAAEKVLSERMPEDLDHIPLDLGGPPASSGWRPGVADSPFEPFTATVFPNPQIVDRDGLVAFYASMGWLADLRDEERLPLLSAVRAQLAAPEYRRMWESHVHWTMKQS